MCYNKVVKKVILIFSIFILKMLIFCELSTTLYKLIAKNPQMQAGRLIPADFFNIGFYSFSL